MNDPKIIAEMPTVKIIKARIYACNTLIDYVLDDIPHARQQPLLGNLRELRRNFDSDLRSEIADIEEKMEVFS